MNDAPLIRWVGVFENVSKTGQQYFVGYAGGLKLVLQRNSKAGEGEPGWNLCVTARPEKSGTTIAKPAAEASIATRSHGRRSIRPSMIPFPSSEEGGRL
jgi:hypothetical protein